MVGHVRPCVKSMEWLSVQRFLRRQRRSDRQLAQSTSLRRSSVVVAATFLFVIVAAFVSRGVSSIGFLAPSTSGGVVSTIATDALVNPVAWRSGTPSGGSYVQRHAGTSIAEPPAPPDVGTRRDKDPMFAQCVVEYQGNDGAAKGESWLFHMDAAFEDEARAEKKPSFPRLLKKSSHIWGRSTTVRCSPLDSVADLHGQCVECVRLFVGGTYGGGVIVPAIDYKMPSKTIWEPRECLALRALQQPPTGDDIAYTETGGGGMPGHEQRMGTFCKTGSFGGIA